MAEHVRKHELMVMYATRYLVTTTILPLVEEGWAVLCILPPLPQLPMPPIVMQSGSSTNYITAAGQIMSNVTQVPQPIISEGYFEITLIKFLDEPDPCPRCSYPYPDPERIDREV